MPLLQASVLVAGVSTWPGAPAAPTVAGPPMVAAVPIAKEVPAPLTRKPPTCVVAVWFRMKSAAPELAAKQQRVAAA